MKQKNNYLTIGNEGLFSAFMPREKTHICKSPSVLVDCDTWHLIHISLGNSYTFEAYKY